MKFELRRVCWFASKMVHFDHAAFSQSVYRWLWGFLYFCARTILAVVLSKDLSRSAPSANAEHGR